MTNSYRSTATYRKVPMSARERFATVNDYPTGLMNLCPCGQVVLAPATHHDGCETTHTA